MKSPLGKRLVAHFNIQPTRNQLSRPRKPKVCNFLMQRTGKMIGWRNPLFFERSRDIYHSTPTPAGLIGIKSALIRKRLLRYGERLPVISPNSILTPIAQPIHHQTCIKISSQNRVASDVLPTRESPTNTTTISSGPRTVNRPLLLVLFAVADAAEFVLFADITLFRVLMFGISHFNFNIFLMICCFNVTRAFC